MDDLIELVARAVAVANGEAGSWNWDWYTEEAEAALAAINRENVVVPRVPCHNMTGAVLEPCEDRSQVVAIYDAMLRASPYYVENEG